MSIKIDTIKANMAKTRKAVLVDENAEKVPNRDEFFGTAAAAIQLAIKKTFKQNT